MFGSDQISRTDKGHNAVFQNLNEEDWSIHQNRAQVEVGRGEIYNNVTIKPSRQHCPI